MSRLSVTAAIPMRLFLVIAALHAAKGSLVAAHH
jgi:hypothetical protein